MADWARIDVWYFAAVDLDGDWLVLMGGDGGGGGVGWS